MSFVKNMNSYKIMAILNFEYNSYFKCKNELILCKISSLKYKFGIHIVLVFKKEFSIKSEASFVG